MKFCEPTRSISTWAGALLFPEMPGIHDAPFLTNSSMMDIDFLPEHLVIVGGSYVGLEFAKIERRQTRPINRDVPMARSSVQRLHGAVLRGPATEPVKTCRVIVEGEIGRVEKEN